MVLGFRIASWREVWRAGSRGEVGVRGMRMGVGGLGAIEAGMRMCMLWAAVPASE